MFHNTTDRAIEVGELAIAAHPDDSGIAHALAGAYRIRVNARQEYGDRGGAVKAARRSLAAS